MKMKLPSFIILLIYILLTENVVCQVVANEILLRDSLSQMSNNIWQKQPDSTRLKANELFFNVFGQVLKNSEKMSDDFDSVAGLTCATSPDRKLKIFTWNIPLSNGTFLYNGFMQYVGNQNIILSLKSTAYKENDFCNHEFSQQNWYGALYYSIIEKEVTKQKIYTLLGWDGLTSASNRKIIDVLTIDNEGAIHLGLPVFKTEKGLQKRVELEYAENANVMLRYDYQSVMLPVKKRLKRISDWLIVFDHLVPLNQSVQGIRKYYVPSGETYDGYWFRDGYWVLVENLEILDKTH